METAHKSDIWHCCFLMKCVMWGYIHSQKSFVFPKLYLSKLNSLKSANWDLWSVYKVIFQFKGHILSDLKINYACYLKQHNYCFLHSWFLLNKYSTYQLRNFKSYFTLVTIRIWLQLQDVAHISSLLRDLFLSCQLHVTYFSETLMWYAKMETFA